LKEESNQESGSEGVSPAKKKWSIGDGEPWGEPYRGHSSLPGEHVKKKKYISGIHGQNLTSCPRITKFWHSELSPNLRQKQTKRGVKRSAYFMKEDILMTNSARTWQGSSSVWWQTQSCDKKWR
jgi:hypothetical protein